LRRKNQEENSEITKRMFDQGKMRAKRAVVQGSEGRFSTAKERRRARAALRDKAPAGRKLLGKQGRLSTGGTQKHRRARGRTMSTATQRPVGRKKKAATSRGKRTLQWKTSLSHRGKTAGLVVRARLSLNSFGRRNRWGNRREHGK